MKKRKTRLAVSYIIFGSIFFLAAVLLIVMMWLSGSFLPIYVGGQFILGNRILRYAIYAFLIFIAYQTGKLVYEAIEYLL